VRDSEEEREERGERREEKIMVSLMATYRLPPPAWRTHSRDQNGHYLSLLLRPGLTILLFISGLVVHSFFKFNFQFPREKLNFTKWKLGMNDGCGGWEIICNVIFMFQIRN
jgi:hypothetical protein